jgi:ABC-type amino acid transport substrate-binding protein
VTAFATGSVVLVLPLLVERSRALLAAAGARNQETAAGVDIIVPAAVSFPNAAKLLALSFVLFAGWFTGQEVGVGSYPRLVVAGVASLFGNVNSAVPFLLDLMRVPADTMQLFVATSVVNARFGSLLGAMHVLVLALLGAGAGAGLVRVRPAALARFALVTVVAGGALLAGARLFFERAVPPPPALDRVLAEMQLVGDPAPSAVLRDSLPPPDPPALAAMPGIDRAVARGRLRVCFRDDLLPLSYTNDEGALVGFDIELAHMLARELSLALDFVPATLVELPERLRSGACDLSMSSIAVTTLRALALTFAPPHLDGTLAFLVEDHRRDDFSSRAAVQALPHPRIAGPNAPYYIDIVKRYLPRAEISVLENPREFVEGRRPELDAYVTTAEFGAAWTLRFPAYAIAIPQPDVLEVPMAYAAARDDLASAHFLGTWLALKRESGVLGRLYDRWVLGRQAKAHRYRWSVLRDVLGVRDAGASEGAPDGSRGLGAGE